MSPDPEQLVEVPAEAAPPAPARLSLRHASKRYTSARGETVTAVQDLSFDVAAGEFVCLVGPSGCGKTTVLNLLAGLGRPTDGEVLHDGGPVPGPGPDRAMLFQDPALFPWMSVEDNVRFAMELASVPSGDRAGRAARWIEATHLSAVARAQPHELSAGMRQRVALARALACEPEVLLADEPFGALDAQTREVLQNELQRMWLETGTTLVFVTHNVREAVFLADRVVVMSAAPGTLLEEHRIHTSRPRSMDDPLLARIAGDLRERLQEEVMRTLAVEEGRPADRP
jgi:NitT/TauT family transport system ATP-binding protein